MSLIPTTIIWSALIAAAATLSRSAAGNEVSPSFSCPEPLKNVTALLYADAASNYTLNTLWDYRHELTDIYRVDVEPINVIPKLCVNSISDLPRLNTLALVLNGIETIEPGSFRNLSALKTLRLSYNRLTSLPKGIFNGLPITELYLTGNRIYDIDTDAFDNVTQLQLLDLSFNHIQLMDGDWFKGTGRMKTLNLMFNLIPELGANSFRHMRNNTGKNNNNFGAAVDAEAINLWFMNNSISVVHRDAFKGLERIGNLSLAANRIRVLDDQVFSRAKHIDSIRLEHNEIFCMSDRLLNGTDADEIYLDGNPMICNCMAKMERWAIATDTRTYGGVGNLNKCGLTSKFIEATTAQPEGVLVEL